jgi:hypothetical protein
MHCVAWIHLTLHATTCSNEARQQLEPDGLHVVRGCCLGEKSCEAWHPRL